jgi:hypothetical protein
MRKFVLPALVVLPLALAGGVLWAKAGGQGEQPRQENAQGYVCPITGEELPCPDCCPLNEQK